jgi:hypothetical protein
MPGAAGEHRIADTAFYAAMACFPIAMVDILCPFIHLLRTIFLGNALNILLKMPDA